MRRIKFGWKTSADPRRSGEHLGWLLSPKICIAN
jgi:hypothetical protein